MAFQEGIKGLIYSLMGCHFLGFLTITKEQKLGYWRYSVLDFGDDGVGFDAFALSLEVEEDTVAECGA